jgi:hypothetical protein
MSQVLPPVDFATVPGGGPAFAICSAAAWSLLSASAIVISKPLAAMTDSGSRKAMYHGGSRARLANERSTMYTTPTKFAMTSAPGPAGSVMAGHAIKHGVTPHK